MLTLIGAGSVNKIIEYGGDDSNKHKNKVEDVEKDRSEREFGVYLRVSSAQDS